MTTLNREIENIVEEIVIPILDKEGLELVDIEYKGNRNRGILRVYIDKQSGINIDECAEVSRELSTLLDIHNPIPCSYTLEVSSPGLNRVLKKRTDYKKFIGNRIKIKTRNLFDRRKVFIGKILEFRDDLLNIEEDGVSLLLTTVKNHLPIFMRVLSARFIQQCPKPCYF